MKDTHRYFADPKELLDDATISDKITLDFATPKDAQRFRIRAYRIRERELARTDPAEAEDHPYSMLVLSVSGQTLTVINMGSPDAEVPIRKVVRT